MPSRRWLSPWLLPPCKQCQGRPCKAELKLTCMQIRSDLLDHVRFWTIRDAGLRHGHIGFRTGIRGWSALMGANVGGMGKTILVHRDILPFHGVQRWCRGQSEHMDFDHPAFLGGNGWIITLDQRRWHSRRCLSRSAERIGNGNLCSGTIPWTRHRTYRE